MKTHSSILAWRPHRERSLEGSGSQGCKELDTTEATPHTRTQGQNVGCPRSAAKLGSALCGPMTPLSVGFPRQENWNGLPFCPPGDLPDPGTKPVVFGVYCIGRWILHHWATWGTLNTGASCHNQYWKCRENGNRTQLARQSLKQHPWCALNPDFLHPVRVRESDVRTRSPKEAGVRVRRMQDPAMVTNSGCPHRRQSPSLSRSWHSKPRAVWAVRIQMPAGKPDSLSHCRCYSLRTHSFLNTLCLSIRWCHLINEERGEKPHRERKAALIRSLTFQLIDIYSNEAFLNKQKKAGRSNLDFSHYHQCPFLSHQQELRFESKETYVTENTELYFLTHWRK